MTTLIDDAALSADLPGACRRAGVSLVDLRRWRLRDPAFDLAMVEVDQVVQLSAIEAVRAQAAAGNLKAIRALTDGTLNLLGVAVEGEAPRTPTLAEALADEPPHVRQAAISALHAAQGRPWPEGIRDKVVCPHCGKWCDAASDPVKRSIKLALQVSEDQANRLNSRYVGASAQESDAPEQAYRKCQRCGWTQAAANERCKDCGCLLSPIAEVKP